MSVHVSLKLPKLLSYCLGSADALKCQVCNLAEPEENFLLCDGCTHGYHAPCLKQEMPQTRFWFCPDCGGLTVKGCVIQVRYLVT